MAPWAAKKKEDYQITGTDSDSFSLLLSSASAEFRQDMDSKLYKCRICPIRSSGDDWMIFRRLAPHAGTSRHQTARAAREARTKQAKLSRRASKPSAVPGVPTIDSTSTYPEPEADHSINSDSRHVPDPQHEHTPHVKDFSPDSVIGNLETDPLAESLAQALRCANGENEMAEDELLEREEAEDPLFCGDEPDITAEELNNHLFGPDSKSDWFPYPDKAMFLTDVLFSSPQLRFSRAQQQAVLSWAKDLGANVPAYSTFRKTQVALQAEVGDPTDMANPFTREGMVFYPEDAGNKRAEVWHGDKMLRDLPDHLLSPTIRHKGVIYYVNELVKRYGNHWFLPKQWLTRSVGTGKDGLIVDAETLDVVEVSSFEANFIQILAETLGIFPLAPQSIDFAEEMPHPLRVVAGSRPVYSIPLAIFIDDVSGNKSKQWNKHFSCYMSNGALPGMKLENEFHVRFVATSPFATPLEIMQGICASIETSFKDPVVVWDCEAKEEVLLQPYGLLFAGDNLMQAELCSCARLNGNFFCCTCHAGGTREWKQSNEGFAETLKAGSMRDPADTAEETFQQILTALEPNVTTTLTDTVRLSGIKDTLAQPIIDALVKMGQDLWKANPDGSSYSPDEVQTILTVELKKHQQKGEGITNPLFDMEGKYPFSLCLIYRC
ncbi:hypothetical protein B0H10DRAFT_1964985 [Mycena sp. CBHHK59/15]|nr:hypothetical protein B0H10DRAFT_1964985 [Mycena sp. CBHHK59/15]